MSWGLPPPLGFGTWQLEGEACRRAVERALELGYRHLDTAEGYENEAEVGAALAASGLPRDEVWVTTKVWTDDRSQSEVREAVEASLERLSLEAADLVLVHWPPRRVPIEVGLEALASLRDEGRLRHVGVSNCPPRHLDRALAVTSILCDQVEYHPYLDQRPLLDHLRARGVLMSAYSPLARGKVMADPVLRRLGARHGKSAAQVVLRWLLQQEGVGVIAKAATPAHQAANLQVFDFALDDAEMEEVFDLARGERLIDPDFAPEWSAGSLP